MVPDRRDRAGRKPRAAPEAGRDRAELVADRDRPACWTLLSGGTPQSHVDLADPRHLEFDYVRRLGHVIDLAGPAGQPLRVLHLGAGALTLARYVLATRPGSRQLAVESDRCLADLVRERLPLGGPASRAGSGGQALARGRDRVRVRVADARSVLGQLAPASFDVVIADAFAAGRTPAHLTSAEFDLAAARVLAQAGSYAVNVADGPPLAHVRARVAAVRSVFPHACLVADSAVLRGRGFGNLVLVASARQIPVAELARRAAADPRGARCLSGQDLHRFTGGAEPITDARPQASPEPPPGAFGRGR